MGITIEWAQGAMSFGRHRDYQDVIANSGGVIAGFFFFAETPRGPPYGTTPDALDSLLAPNFRKIADEPVTGSIEVFRGKERWQVWQAQSP